ncbi:MAG: Do family serine endopeptidase [Rhodospirillales bacterium]|nr:Do family serine endopeptidase [Rhodospirillales bacterium]
MNGTRVRPCWRLPAAIALVVAGLLAPALDHAAGVARAEASELPSLAPMLTLATPAVVNIAVLSRVAVQDNPLLRDPFFRRFFNIPDLPRELPPRISAGSGVIVDAERGYVLTNHHVIAQANEVYVTLKDRRRLPARLVGSDPPTDIAVLKIEPDRLTALPFGNSDALQVGDYVVAIGNPFGLGQTVTSGIISALGRSGLNVEGYEDFIQTDASINPGNSGGALVNLRGELIGINTAIISPAGGNVGIGFAVPSNMVRAVMEQLIAYGTVRRGRLGIRMQPVTADLAETLRLPEIRGALIASVEPGTPADASGLKPGDVVVGVNGRRVDDPADLRARLGLLPPGERVDLTIIRNGRTLSIRARIE